MANGLYQNRRLYSLNKLLRGQAQSGFTLIELLVVIVIMGILAAIGAPILLNQASRARESEGKVNVGAINRAQQLYWTEFGRLAGNNSQDTSDPACIGLCVIDVGVGQVNAAGEIVTNYYRYALETIQGAPVAQVTANPDGIAEEIRGFLGCSNTSGQTKIVEGSRVSVGGGSNRTPSSCSSP